MVVDTLVRDVPTFAAPPAPVRFSRRWAFVLLAIDGAMLALACALATYVAQRVFHATVPDRNAITAAACVVVWLLLFHRVGLYRSSFALAPRDEFYCAIAALVLGATPLLLLFTIVPAISSSRLVVLLSLAAATFTVGASRFVARSVHGVAERTRPKRVAVVGTARRVEAALEQLGSPPGSEMLRVVIDDITDSVEGIGALSTLETYELPWLKRARDWRCDTLVLTEMLPPDALPALLRIAAFEHFTVAFAPPRFREQAYELRLESDGRQALLVARQLYAFAHGARIVKRTADLAFAIVGLLIAGPIMLAAALAIVLEDRGPVFFRQQRVGLLGEPFDVLKFRSMRTDAETRSGPIWSPARDERVTRVGRFLRRSSIDELPQLINVLRGDMSIVGPRPERPIFVERFRRALPRYDERHLVRPGITGWAQVNMERKLDPSQAGEKLRHDLWYVEHWSLFLDLSIVVKTAAEFLFHRA